MREPVTSLSGLVPFKAYKTLFFFSPPPTQNNICCQALIESCQGRRNRRDVFARFTSYNMESVFKCNVLSCLPITASFLHASGSSLLFIYFVDCLPDFISRYLEYSNTGDEKHLGSHHETNKSRQITQAASFFWLNNSQVNLTVESLLNIIELFKLEWVDLKW